MPIQGKIVCVCASEKIVNHSLGKLIAILALIVYTKNDSGESVYMHRLTRTSAGSIHLVWM